MAEWPWTAGIIQTMGYCNSSGLSLEQYDFSAHAGDKELKAIVKDFCDRGTKAVFTMHGDNTEGFATWMRRRNRCAHIQVIEEIRPSLIFLFVLIS